MYLGRVGGRGAKSTVAAALTGMAAMVSHGNGIAVLAIIPLVYLIQRRYLTAACIGSVLIAVYASLWLMYPSPVTHLSPDSLIVTAGRWDDVLLAMATHIGSGLSISVAVAPGLGIVGAVIGTWAITDVLRRWTAHDTIDARDAFYVSLVLYGILTASLAGVLKVAYTPPGEAFDLWQLTASRYVPTSVFLWIGTALYAGRRGIIPASAIFALTFYCFSYGIYIYESADRTMVAQMRETKRLFSSGIYDHEHLMFAYPNEAQSRHILDVARKYGISQ